MNRNNISDATLNINNPVICPNCTRNLPLALPPGGQMTVVLPNGAQVLFKAK
jgi:hypothetical protein